MSENSLQLPENTRTRLEQFRRTVRRVKLTEAILAGLFGLVMSYLVVFAVDRWYDTPGWVRGLSLLSGTLGLALFLPWMLHRWVWGTRSLRQVAIILKHKFPTFGDQVLGVIELVDSERAWNESRRLAEAAIAQVDDEVRVRDLSVAVPRPRHRQWALLAAVPVLTATVALCCIPAAGWNAVARWALPWQAIERFTFARVEALPATMVVPHGEAFPLAARLTPATQWSPGTASARVQQQPVVTAAQQEGGYVFDLPPQIEAGTVHLRVGDLTRDVRVDVAARPELVGVTAQLTLPEYLQLAGPRTADVRGGAISVLAGTTVEFHAQISRELASAAVDGEPLPITGDQLRTTPLVVSDSSVLEFTWEDSLGLSSRDPFRLRLQTVADAAPDVFLQQQEPQTVVLSTDTILFDLKSRDDFGVRQMGLEWSTAPGTASLSDEGPHEKLVQVGGPEQTALTSTASFCAERDGLSPQVIEMRAFAEDYLPGRERSYSTPLRLQVMSPTEHAVWMMDQLRRWASRADDVYEEEMRLHDANRQLRQLSAEELNEPDVRRQIEQQAASERANGERLVSVTAQGDALIKQALRNPDMLVGHLETWAQALTQLRHIANQRMPNVADLLTAGAKAPGRTPAKPATSASKVGPSVGQNLGTMPPAPGGMKPPTPAVPGISDVESGSNPPQPPKPPSDSTSASRPKFGLPTTTLQGGPPSTPPPPPATTATGEKMEAALEEQAGLLLEFEKIREELQKIMDDLENSTFVKRFKAAAREQLEVANALNRTLFDSFGNSQPSANTETEVERRQRLADVETRQSGKINDIQSDLSAYFDRCRESKFERVLNEMKELDVVDDVAEVGARVLERRPGDSLARAEFWSDVLDRWAEELVSASKCGQCKGCKGESLPPSIVLEVMRILEGEMDLREETRTLEGGRSALSAERYGEQATAQSDTQAALLERTQAVMLDIRALPMGAEKFGQELSLLSAAASAMDDATQILSEPETGGRAIAAETEAIEMLLRSKRCNPGGGGGGGSNPGGGGQGDTDRVALEAFGPGFDALAKVEQREPPQATGGGNDSLPSEFRDGIDAFFHALEQR